MRPASVVALVASVGSLGSPTCNCLLQELAVNASRSRRLIYVFISIFMFDTFEMNELESYVEAGLPGLQVWQTAVIYATVVGRVCRTRADLGIEAGVFCSGPDISSGEDQLYPVKCIHLYIGCEVNGKGDISKPDEGRAFVKEIFCSATVTVLRSEFIRIGATIVSDPCFCLSCNGYRNCIVAAYA